MTDAARTSTADPGPPGVARWLRPERAYLVVALVFGGAFLALTPPFQVADEENHFRRAYHLSEGRVLARKVGDVTGDELPRGVGDLYGRFSAIRMHPEQKTTAADIVAAAEVRADPGEREFVAFYTAVHPPLTYLPQALGVFLARQFSPSVLAAFYAGRLLNFLTAVAVTFLAVRLAPVGKWAFAALALTPMTLFEAASLASDALTNALGFLLVAQVLAMAFGPGERMPAGSVTRTALLGAAVGLAKQAYFLLPFCYLLIPARRAGTPRRYWAGFAVVMGVTFLAVAGWSPLVRAVYSPPDPTLGMDPERQVLLMRSDPVGFLLVLWRTALRAGIHVGEYLGTLGWLDTPLPAGVRVAEAVLLLAVCAAEFGPWSGVTARQALVAAGVALLVALTVLVVMHIIWDVVGSTYVEVQGRHFIPAGPLVGLALGRFLGGLVPRAWRAACRAVPGAVAVGVPVLLAASLVRACDRYYADSPRAAAERAYARGRTLQKEHAPGDRVREKFEEALRLNPDHASAHFFLAQLVERTRPREAAEHYRASLRGDPGGTASAAALDDGVRVVALNNLAGHALREGDSAEAVRLYREALRIDPGNANVKGNLARALRSGELEAALRELPAALRGAARAAGLSEERHPGTPLHGLYLRPARGPVAAPLPAPFVWRSPPPGGGELRLDGPAAAGAPFFACSAGPLAGPGRVFVFPDRAALLADEEVSWYYQRPLPELSAAEREREAAYRRERGLRFPLAAPPD